MAKAEPLNPNDLKAEVVTPKAATPARSSKGKKPVEESESKTVPIQFRVPEDVALDIRISALKNKQTLGQFMQACFHAYKAANKGKD